MAETRPAAVEGTGVSIFMDSMITPGPGRETGDGCTQGHEERVETPLAPLLGVIPATRVEEIDLRFLARWRLGQPHRHPRSLPACLGPVSADIAVEGPPARLQLVIVVEALVLVLELA